MAHPTDLSSAHAARPVSNGGGPRPADASAALEHFSGDLQARIVAMEQRHTAALREMQAKLERLSGQAERARPAMPTELATAFDRIEAGMADLVERIAESVPELPQPAGAFVFGERKAEHSHFVFDPPAHAPVAPVQLESTARSSEPWDNEAAEALVHLYASGEAVLGKHLPDEPLFAPARRAGEAHATRVEPAPAVVEPAPNPAADRPPETSGPTSSVAPETAVTMDPAPDSATSPTTTPAPDDDHAWFDRQFAALTAHVSKTIDQAQPASAMDALLARVDQFESRFTAALGQAAANGAASPSPQAFALIEAQIKDLGSHVAWTQTQLSRLDSIEQHLADLTEFAEASMAEPASAPHPVQDIGAVAELAVERALARSPVGTSADVVDTQARMQDMQAVLVDFAAERRRGEQLTASTLETVQEALLRLFDRLDVIESARSQGTAAAADRELVQPAQVPGPTGTDPASADLSSRPASPIKTLKTIRRREQRVMEPQPPVQADASGDTVVGRDIVAQNAQKEPANFIADLDQLLAQAAPRSASDASAAPVAQDVAAQVAAKAAPVNALRRPVSPAQSRPTVQGSGRSHKRGMAIAAAACSLIGLSYAASLLFADQFSGVLQSKSANLGKPAAGVGSALQPSSKPDRAEAPPQFKTLPPSGTSGTPPLAEKPAAAPIANDLQFTPTKPASVPETASDDLSDATPILVPPGGRRGRTALAQHPSVAIAGEHLTAAAQPNAPLPGMALSSSRTLVPSGVEQAAQRFAEAAKSAPVAPPPSLLPPARVPQPTAAITTGTTGPDGRQPEALVAHATVPPASVDVDGDALSTPAEFPPALVGPLSLRLAALRGDASAAFEVATRFAEGRGIQQNFKQAMSWYLRSAGKGFAVAQYRLGTLYERGLGIAPDVPRARIWYQRAAEQGNVKAMHNLAALSASPIQGNPDYPAAAKWFQAAARFGLSDSQYNLGVLYENGLGVLKDQREAYIWYALAARGGDLEATRHRDHLITVLDSETIASANTTISGWHALASNSIVNDARVAGDQWQHAAQNEVAAPPASAAPPSSPPRAAKSAQTASNTRVAPRATGKSR